MDERAENATICWRCGKPASETRRITLEGRDVKMFPITPYVRCYCDECREVEDKREANIREKYNLLKRQLMLIKACDMLEDQWVHMYDYRPAIRKISKYINDYPDTFDSSYEVLAAIILVHNKIRVKMQYPIDKFRVDFLLPDEKVVLEIDGEFHRYQKHYDKVRDMKIKRILGDDWKIVRIHTGMLDKDVGILIDALNAVTEYRKTGKIEFRGIQI